jgi:transposase
VRIGEKKANGLLALLPELGLLDRKQIASLAAVAPHPKQSGQKTWYSRTVGGRKIYQTYIIFSRTHASKSKSSLGNFYNILIHKGKKLMLALVALMRKIIVIAKNVRFTDIVSIFCP